PSLKHVLLKNYTSQLLTQIGFFPRSTDGDKGSKFYISSADMSKPECPSGTMAAVETEPSAFYGSQSSSSVWEPDLGTGRPPRYTGAVVVVQNGGSRIGAGWYIDPDMYADNHAHFEIAWTDNDKSCTNLRCAGFVQLSTRIVPGAVLKPVSMINGKQYLMMVSIFKVWDTWVLLFGEELVGYWPGKLFTNLSGPANMIGWMGVASAASGEAYPPMGSGRSPDEGEGRAAFFTDVKVIDAPTSKYVSPYLSEIFTRTTNPKCYQVGTPSTSDMGLDFYFGGAGCSPSQFIK
ncbi:hypothetical protein E2562_035172, partial [Oryza meyeriana var. granulata]